MYSIEVPRATSLLSMVPSCRQLVLLIETIKCLIIEATTPTRIGLGVFVLPGIRWGVQSVLPVILVFVLKWGSKCCARWWALDLYCEYLGRPAVCSDISGRDGGRALNAFCRASPASSVAPPAARARARYNISWMAWDKLPNSNPRIYYIAIEVDIRLVSFRNPAKISILDKIQ